MPSAQDLEATLTSAKSVSEYIASAPHDGHWKGKGSGWGTQFVAASLPWAILQKSPWVDAMKGSVRGYLISNLYANGGYLPQGFAFPPVGPAPTGNVIKISTTQVTKPDNTYVFARIRVDDGVYPITYDEALVKTPARAIIIPFWCTIHFADANVNHVQIDYRLVARTMTNTGEGSFPLRQAPNLPNGEYILDYNLNGTLSGNIAAQPGMNPAPLTGPNRSATITVTHEQLR
jgi:hypothetical protein